MSHILVVEDESAIAELVSINLRHAGFEVTIAGTAEQAQAAVDGVLPDLIILDWMLPGQSGVALAKRWRAEARTRELPVIMLTARADEADKITGLDAGADDYLTKPFSTNELMARIRALLRRKAPEALDAAVEVGALRIDPATRRVTRGDADVKVGATEFRLLHFFHDASGAGAQPPPTARPGLGRPCVHRRAHGRRAREAAARGARASAVLEHDRDRAWCRLPTDAAAGGAAAGAVGVTTATAASHSR